MEQLGSRAVVTKQQSACMRAGLSSQTHQQGKTPGPYSTATPRHLASFPAGTKVLMGSFFLFDSLIRNPQQSLSREAGCTLASASRWSGPKMPENKCFLCIQLRGRLRWCPLADSRAVGSGCSGLVVSGNTRDKKFFRASSMARGRSKRAHFQNEGKPSKIARGQCCGRSLRQRETG